MKEIGRAPDGTAVDFSKIVAISNAYRCQIDDSYLAFDIHFIDSPFVFQQNAKTSVSIRMRSFRLSNSREFEENQYREKRDEFVSQWEKYKEELDFKKQEE